MTYYRLYLMNEQRRFIRCEAFLLASDEEAIERWKEERWPSLKKGRKRKAGP